MRTIKWLLQFVRPYWKWMLLSITLSSATVTSGIGLIGTSTYLISRASQQPSIAALQIAIVGVRFFGISRGIFRYLERLVSHATNLGILTTLRRWLYDKLEPLTPAIQQKKRSGDLLSQVTADIDTLEIFFVRVLSPIFVAFLITFGMGIFVGIVSWKLSLILVIGLTCNGIFVPIFSKIFSLRGNENLSKFRGELSASITESIQGTRDILAYHMVKQRLEKIEELSKRIEITQNKIAIGESVIDALSQMFPQLTLFAAIWVATILVFHGELEGIMYGVILLMILSSFESVQPLGKTAQNLEQSQQAAERLYSIEEEKPQITTPEKSYPLPMNPKIVFSQLSFRYPDREKLALKDIDLEICPGEKCCMIGRSGAGKSTIFDLLFRFWDINPGKIMLQGVDIRKFDPEEIRSLFSVVSQNNALVSGSLRKNLLLGNPNANEEQMIQALHQVGLLEWVDHLPNKLDTWIGEHGAKISGGESTRLMIARALLRASPIWILDEPTAHLDMLAERKIIQLLHEITLDHTAIWATHRLFEMEKFDSILVLEEGHIVERGTHLTLVSMGGMYQKYWDNQSYL